MDKKTKKALKEIRQKYQLKLQEYRAEIEELSQDAEATVDRILMGMRQTLINTYVLSPYYEIKARLLEETEGADEEIIEMENKARITAELTDTFLKEMTKAFNLHREKTKKYFDEIQDLYEKRH